MTIEAEPGVTRPAVYQQLQDAKNGLSPRASRRSTDRHLDFGPVIPILDFWPPQLEEKRFLLF